MSDKLFGTVKAGKTDVSLPILLTKTTDGTEQTGTLYSGVTASYWRQGGTRTAITTAALTNVDDAHSDGGWKEVDSTNQPGVYRLDIPDAAFATGADWVIVSVKVSGCFVYHERFNLESAGSSEVYGRIGTNGAGLTALGDTRLGNLDAAVSTRASSTQAQTIITDIANIPQPDLSNMAQQTTLEAVQTELEHHANPAGQGARTVTFTVLDGDGAPVEGARVRLTKGVETYTATTDASGEAQLFVDDGTWTYVVTRTGYSSASGSVVVDGDETLSVEIAAYVIPPASDPDLVSVVARPLDFELTPDATFHLTLDEPRTVVIGGRFQLKTVQSDTAENGEAVLEVFPSSALVAAGYVDTYTLTCNQDRRLKKRIRVPDAGGDAAALEAVTE